MLLTKEELGKRLNQFFNGHKQHGLAKKIRVPQPTLSGLMLGRVYPSVQTLQALMQNTNINIEWYLTGKTPEHRNDEGKGYHYIEQGSLGVQP